MKVASCFIFVFIHFFCQAQKDRYHFAESYFGIESEFIAENKSFINPSSQEANLSQLPSTLSPRILIGGTHFWGHADFYVSIPLANLNLNGSQKVNISNGTFLGFRVIPLKLKDNTLRPYLGLGLNGKEFQYLNGPRYANWQLHGEAGFQFRKSRRIMGLGFRYFPKNEFNAAFTRSDFQKIETSPFSISLSYSFVFDATAGYSKESVQRYMKKLYKRAEETNAFSAFSFAIGVNGLIPLNKTELASRKAFFNDKIEGNISPDIGIAYLNSKLNLSYRISFRPLKQEEEAYGYSHKVRRNSTAFELLKFVGDYHGFVPFIGPYISYDYYRISEKDKGAVIIDDRRQQMGYGIVFGWDIRQSRLDFLTLRTNLRYSPTYSYKSSGYKFTTDQLEFNFIQLVFYPERYKLYKHK